MHSRVQKGQKSTNSGIFSENPSRIPIWDVRNTRFLTIFSHFLEISGKSGHFLAGFWPILARLAKTDKNGKFSTKWPILAILGHFAKLWPKTRRVFTVFPENHEKSAKPGFRTPGVTLSGTGPSKRVRNPDL